MCCSGHGPLCGTKCFVSELLWFPCSTPTQPGILALSPSFSLSLSLSLSFSLSLHLLFSPSLSLSLFLLPFLSLPHSLSCAFTLFLLVNMCGWVLDCVWGVSLFSVHVCKLFSRITFSLSTLNSFLYLSLSLLSLPSFLLHPSPLLFRSQFFSFLNTKPRTSLGTTAAENLY